MNILKFLAGLFTLIIAYLVTVIFTPLVKAKPQPIKGKLPKSDPPPERESFTYYINKTPVKGWFYSKGEVGTFPCVILSHGFCGTKDGLMENYALKFMNEGFNVITYDFRHFGESGGEPRQLYCGPYQLEDLQCMIDYARSRSDVDDDGIFLWGTSAGAHLGILAASTDPQIAGVIGQCGAYDTKADHRFYMEKVGMGHFLKLFVHAQRDKGRSRFGLSPHMIPAYGKPGTIAFFNLPGVYDHLEEILGSSETFRNEVSARFAFMPHTEDPLAAAEKVECPVLIQTCLEDGMVAPDTHTRLLEILGPKATHIGYPINHFAIYLGENYEKATHDQVTFLKEHYEA